ncbi:hypothetical protein BDW74DRAFT_153474 [Aspergillus multicolor]|uniref:uncharacterized protein n=1 Tax=Aspergillus multicolor TaxID=41759 RepID=UPI003CCC8F99
MVTHGQNTWPKRYTCLCTGVEIKFTNLVPPEDTNLSTFTPFLDGENKRLFLEFIGKMLHWARSRRSGQRPSNCTMNPALTLGLDLCVVQ